MLLSLTPAPRGINTTSASRSRRFLPEFVGGSSGSEEVSYVDEVARQSASSNCVRCARRFGTYTAAVLYEGMYWQYCYCYDCKHWFRRHLGQRYAVLPVDDTNSIKALTHYIESQREMLDFSFGVTSWLKRASASVARRLHAPARAS